MSRDNTMTMNIHRVNKVLTRLITIKPHGWPNYQNRELEIQFTTSTGYDSSITLTLFSDDVNKMAIFEEMDE